MTRRRLLLLALLAAGPATAASGTPPAPAEPGPQVPRFEDASGALPGPPHAYAGGWEHFVGGGVAVFDCNGDARPDIVAAGGTAPARLYVNASAPGAMAFTAGVLPALGETTGVWPLDIDGDGRLDLAVLSVGTNHLLRGDGACGFADASADWSFDGGDRWSTAFSATFEAGRDHPTLAIGNYVDRTDPAGPFEACDVNALYRWEGAGYAPPVTLEPGFCALSMLFSDHARRGTADLRVSNDRHYYVRGGSEQMWHMPGLTPMGPEDGFDPVSIWGMGIASRDLTGDGLPEIVLTSMGDQLMMLAEPGGWRPAPYSIGTYAQRPFLGDDGRPSTGWHAEFADVNNDALADLFIAKGNVDQMPTNAMEDPNNLLLQRADGTFEEAADRAGIATVERARGAALEDFDGDGALDLVVVNRRAPLELWRNAGVAGRAVRVEVRQDGPNPFAVGAFVERRRPDGTLEPVEITVGGGHGGGRAGPVHFGIADADAAQIRVVWPDGTASPFVSVAAGRAVLHRTATGIDLR
ncbi:CRTAC1 family protein [Acuticoccus sp. I52.16.1]|uniref:CRTAC1 family protein n=1 Tax=Acuticoccus sp. I52.16.1 TaxID=2928472 RepID=UPI001FD0CA83|nr:CRTAC1 family protein [Acuticoccus sp. I52.16.1]UOM34359.1 CRTAC1 family protein [Acuticoccus sp. I52.16.1]